MKIISYESKISFMKEAKKIFSGQKEYPSAVMMCQEIIGDLEDLRDFENAPK